MIDHDDDRHGSTAALRSLSGRPTLRGHLAIMRFDHWFKQVFVLPGIAVALSDTAGNIPGGLGARLVVGFLSVSLVCSSNYVINEVLDAPSDLSHPTKSARPVPSGLVNIPLAYVQWIAADARRRRARLRRQRAARASRCSRCG